MISSLRMEAILLPAAEEIALGREGERVKVRHNELGGCHPHTDFFILGINTDLVF